MSQDGDGDPINFMERVWQLTVKVYLTMSVEDRENIAATHLFSGMRDCVITQQLLATGVTDSAVCRTNLSDYSSRKRE